MSRGEEIFREIQRKARTEAAGGAPATAELVLRHGLESFLDRLNRTTHADSFVLKGGVLLAAYDVRRPTKDIDAEAVSTSLSADNVRQIVADIAAVLVDDGVVFDIASLDVQEIRDQAEYPGLRVRVNASLGAQPLKISWDISTGDPIVPSPRPIRINRVFGDPIEMLGYAPETVIAEKGVTILERGITSTRWKDYVDIVRLAEQLGSELDENELLRSAQAVARYRGVTLAPIGVVIAGYGAVAQPKWAAWRRKEGFENLCAADLDDQMEAVGRVLDPVFGRGSET